MATATPSPASYDTTSRNLKLDGMAFMQVNAGDYSSWTVLAILVPAFKRASRGGRATVGSGDLLLEFCRRMGAKAPLLRSILKSNYPAPDGPRSDIQGRAGSVDPLSLYGARAVLREAVRAGSDFLIGEQPSMSPAWTAGAVHVLAEARAISAERHLPWVGDREVLLALLASEGTTASALVTRSGVDRGEVLSEVGLLKSFQGKHPWAPAVDSLERVGLLRVNVVSRILVWPINAISRKIDGPSSGLLTTLEEEAGRQAVREGATEVQFEHVVLAAASITHQLALSEIPEPEELRNSQPILDGCGLSYADLIRRLVARAGSALSASAGESLTIRARPPVASPEVEMAFEQSRGRVAQGASYPEVLEQLFAMPQARSAISALTAD